MEINVESDDLMKRAAGELREAMVSPSLEDLRQTISRVS